MPTLLVKDHGYSDSFMMFSSFLNISMYLIGIFTGKKIMEYKVNYILLIRLLLLIAISLQIILHFFISSPIVDQLPYLFYLYRGGDGFINGIIYILTSSIFTFELTKNSKRLEIASLNYTIGYFLKIFAPIFAGGITYYSSNNDVILTSILFYSTAILLLTDVNSTMFMRIHKGRVKHFNFDAKRFKLKFLSEVRPSIDFDIFRRKSILKIEVYRIIFINNSFRNFYDVALILILTTEFNLSIVKAGVVFSAMVLGQSLNFFGMMLTKKIINTFPSKHIFVAALAMYIPTFVLISLLLSLIIHNITIDMILYNCIIGLAFVIGISRSIFASLQEYYYYVFVEDDKKNVMEYSSFKLIISEIGHIAGYLLASIALVFGYKYFLSQLLFLIFLQMYLTSRFSENNIA